MRLPVNTVIHTTLVGLEPATFRSLVRRATSSATEPTIIKSLSGTLGSNAANEAMILDDRTISSDVGKANAFMSHYASVDSLFQRKRGRKIVIENARQCCVDNEAGKNYTITELNLAIAKMKARGAAGPDDILPTFLKALGQVGPCSRSHLLHIFNTSFTEVHLPKCGRMQSV